MREKMKVHAFGVSPVESCEPLEVLLQEISACSLPDRVRSVGSNDYRVEDIRKKDGFWLVDFVKFREEHGPGAASKATPVRGFDFEENEVFSEETAMLYDPKTKHAVLQYNHYGARVGSIQEYFNCFADDEIYVYEFRPKYDEDAERRFKQRAATRNITFAIDPRFLNQKDREKGTALAQAIEIGESSNGARVELTISAGHERKRYLSKFIDKTAVALKLKAENSPDAVPKLQVGILPNLDSAVETVDLIAQRLSLTFEKIEVGEDLRFPRKARYKALRRAFNGWKKLF